MKQLYRYDKDGRYLEPVLVEETEPIPNDCTDIPIPQPNWKPLFDKNLNKWIETLSEDEMQLLTGNSLENRKKIKENELNSSCNQSILDGFDHIIDGISYHFNFDYDAQLNFQGADRLLDKGLVPAIEWTVSRNGEYERILITKAIMDELVIKILQHKDSNIRKFRNELMPLVEDAQSQEELDLIVW